MHSAVLSIHSDYPIHPWPLARGKSPSFPGLSSSALGLSESGLGFLSVCSSEGSQCCQAAPLCLFVLSPLAGSYLTGLASDPFLAGLLHETEASDDRIVVPQRGRSTRVPVSSVLI